jgi:hypothetical protein
MLTVLPHHHGRGLPWSGHNHEGNAWSAGEGKALNGEG